MNVLVLTGSVAALVALTVGYLVSKLYSRSDEQFSLDWVDEFSVENYRPMERLLDENDYRFLAVQPGYRPEIGRKLRAERKKIFRDDRRQLTADFRKLANLAKLMLVHSPVDRPDLARSISRLQRRFYLSVLKTEICLALAPLQIGRVDPSGLIEALAYMREEIQASLPAAQFA